MALGALEVIDVHRLTGKIIVVGFDGGREAIQAIRDGRPAAVIAQSPINIGRQAYLTAYHAAKGEMSEKGVDTGTPLIDKNNVDEFFLAENNRNLDSE
jgi:ribose transport system substrate-binding protein